MKVFLNCHKVKKDPSDQKDYIDDNNNQDHFFNDLQDGKF